MMTYGKFPLTLATAALIAVGAVVATAQDTSAPAASAITNVQPTKAEYRDSAHKKGGKHHRAGLFGGRGGGEMMQDIFAEIDADGDGAVTQTEVDTYRAAKVSQADTSGDGALSLDEFDVIYREMTRTRMVDAFQRLDADGDGQISAAEMDRRFGSIVERMDRDNDGALTLQRGRRG